MAAGGSSGDWRFRVRRCTSTKKGLSLCHKQSEVSDCHIAGVENGETEGKKSLTMLSREPTPAKNLRQGF